ncbi:DUF5673 domain-containing protein [Miniphocaeibacter massiliensis]|uniref:DUF5673 domain-containing protein n=1 Tax=Miniphocaeibacter massiliensis TaxID=2041841 RepID=UPI000C083809|nr:DUF5673 domain-containing protein [Miniphocaeibacter massiliensis]
MDFNRIIQIIYFLMFLFILKQLYNIVNVKKSIEGKKLAVYNPKVKIYIGLLVVALLLLGTMTLVNKDYFGIIYILTGLGFAYVYVDKVIVYETGIYYNGRLDSWNEIKKWTYDARTSNLRLETTKPGNKAYRSIPIKNEDKENILSIIRNRKNKKKNKVKK